MDTGVYGLVSLKRDRLSSLCKQVMMTTAAFRVVNLTCLLEQQGGYAMDLFQIILIVSTLLCSLVAGFLLAFVIVVMPGIKELPDREFIRAFQVMDGVIQNNQPLFMIVWVGSVFTLIVSAILGIWHLDGIARITLLVATCTYIVGVQLPTMIINVPLNNRLQALDVSLEDHIMQKQGRKDFESRWNYWNSIRTIMATLLSVTLMVLL